MDLSFWFFVSSGLFLGWSLGANDAANIFGTAVATRMVQFRTAAILCAIFVLLGAVISGSGAAHTLGALGGVDRIAGAFMVALAAALAVFSLLRSGLTASTSQAIIGAVVGWSLYNGRVIDTTLLLQVVSTWILCPLLAGVLAVILYKLTQSWLDYCQPHLLRLDAYTRLALLVTGAFGAYALGANNIANVMGVFSLVSPFQDKFYEGFHFSATQQLFLLGSIAIGVGVFTYSKKVMMTVGNGLMQLSPALAWVVVCAHSLVLFLFSSQTLQKWLIGLHLPALPLVPVSSTQAIIGAVVGIGLLRGGRGLNWRLLGRLGSSWALTPLVACLLAIIGLFLLQNLFHQDIARQERYVLNRQTLHYLSQQGWQTEPLQRLSEVPFNSSQRLVEQVERLQPLNDEQRRQLLYASYEGVFYLNAHKVGNLDLNWYSQAQWQALSQLAGRRFSYRWQLEQALMEQSPAWRPGNGEGLGRFANQERQAKLQQIFRVFEVEPSQ
ncbi:inorganic phosphate transporter [Balneatrix alpica]|uniref:Phosphate transporter n=1 Tax=Balneatrix alpica TaxID=75684 RepID=A0ABV5Z9G7_9GAMM|nr:inorganic phosphate transporter [Balneatrix alpica]